MIIQPILFPPEYFKNEPDLFFRGINQQYISNDKLMIPAGAEVSLETYFNSFSIGKWLEYTNLDILSLNLKIQGNVEIKAYHAVGSVDNELLDRESRKYTEEYINLVNTRAYKAEREEVDIQVIHENDIFKVKFPHLYEDGILYVTIKSVTDAVLLEGGYSTEYDESWANPVKIAVGICTFRREKAVVKNVVAMLTDILSNPQSPLSDKLEIYIADNGQTLSESLFQSDKVHLFPNLNLGGSGGFTRTMIEAMIYDKAKSFTHIIFMDDDILLYPSVLERTYYLLRMLKEEYRKAILGAGMFMLGRCYLQQEYGSFYKSDVTYIGKANHKFFDLRNPDSVSANEAISKSNYVGWWYACIPKDIINENNLPMPYFIHFDDVEYGLRNLDNKELFLNGICIWHPHAGSAKNPLWITYYNIRNRLITMFSMKLGKKELKTCLKKITRNFMFKIIRYEYIETQMMLNAIQDFLSGPDAFIKNDALALHAKLSEAKKLYISPSDLGIKKDDIIRKGIPKCKRTFLIQFFWNLLPPRDAIKAMDIQYYNVPANSKKVYLYNEELDSGLLLERDIKKFFSLLFSFVKTIFVFNYQYKKQMHEWQNAKSVLTSLPFWEKYLGLKSEKENKL